MAVEGDKLYILCIFTLQCCAQAPLIRQRSTSQNPLLVGVGFAYIGPRHSTSKNPLLLLLSAWGQIYQDLTPETPQQDSPNQRLWHIFFKEVGAKLTGRQNEKGRKKSSFSWSILILLYDCYSLAFENPQLYSWLYYLTWSIALCWQVWLCGLYRLQLI